MGGSRSPRSATIAAFVAATLILGATSIVATPAVDAKKPKVDGVVDCPAKVGSYPLDKVRAAPEVHTQNCYYDRPKKKGWAILTVDWWPDEDGERRGCETREPALTDLPGVKGRAAQLTSPTRNVRGIVSLADEARVSLADAQAPLQRLIRAAEPLGHPCVPAETPVTGPGPSCPLLLPGDLVRTDWYAGDPQVAGALGDGSDGRFGLRCLYLPAYDSDEGGGIVRVQWLEGESRRQLLVHARDQGVAGQRGLAGRLSPGRGGDGPGVPRALGRPGAG